VLAAASGKTKEEVEELLARLFPQRDVRSPVRPLPPANAASAFEVHAQAPAPSPPPMPPPVSARPVVRALAPERYEIRFTASGATREKLRLAQDLLGHAVPNGDLAEVFDRALTLLVEDLRRKKSRRRSGRARALANRTIRGTSRPRCGGRWWPETRAAAHSWPPAPSAARSVGSSSSTTSNPTARAASRPWRTSSSDAGPTTATRRRSSMDRAESTAACSGSRSTNRRCVLVGERRPLIRSGTDESRDRYVRGSVSESRT